MFKNDMNAANLKEMQRAFWMQLSPLFLPPCLNQVDLKYQHIFQNRQYFFMCYLFSLSLLNP